MNSKNFFNQVANQWDEMRKGFFSDRVRDMAITKANVQSGGLAADIGTGTGFITESLMKKRY
jgi:ubiquinone/menaquinone biosynthesis C-methylase UbiE